MLIVKHPSDGGMTPPRRNENMENPSNRTAGLIENVQFSAKNSKKMSLNGYILAQRIIIKWG